MLCTGQRAAADRILAEHGSVGYLAAQVRLDAAFAMADGDRPRAKRLLRSAWLTHPPGDTEAWNVLQSLLWLVLEDGQQAETAVLAADLARLSPEQPSVPLTLYLCDVRCGRANWQPQRWATLVRANAGLVNRHAWLLDDTQCQAWMQGTGPKLPVLLTDACY